MTRCIRDPDNIVRHITFALSISVKPATSFAVMMDFWLAIQPHALVSSFHGHPETILLQASMGDLEGIISSRMILQEG
jgi:hypothetical protein